MTHSAYAVLVGDPGVHAALAAFYQATGLSVKLVPADPQACLDFIQSQGNPLCSLILKSRAGRAACQAFAQSLTTPACARQCFSGLTELAVPVRLAGQPVALLVCGQVLQRKPTRQDFARVRQRLERAGISVSRARAATAFFQTRVVSETQLHAAAHLLNILAQHLAETADHRLIASSTNEPSRVRAAKSFVQSHLTESFTMHRVAAETHVSPQHFCRTFKAATGMTFTEYHCRVRVAKAKELLADPTRQISDVAFTAGFESIPYFDRIFKRYVGTSPTEYRHAHSD